MLQETKHLNPSMKAGPYRVGSKRNKSNYRDNVKCDYNYFETTDPT